LERIYVAIATGMAVWAYSARTRGNEMSVSYLYAARSLVEHGRLDDVNGTPLTLFPPTYSFVLAAVHELGIGWLASGRLVNVLAFAAATAVAATWVRRLSGSSFIGLVGGVAACVLPAFVWTAYLAPETLFIALVVGAAYALVLGIERGSGWMFVVAGVLLGIGVTARYAGIFFVPPALLLGWASDGGSWPHRLRNRVAPIAAGVIATTAPLLVRNLAIDSSAPLGPRHPSAKTVGTVLHEGAIGLGRVVASVPTVPWMLGLALLGALAVASLVAWVTAWRPVSRTRRIQALVAPSFAVCSFLGMAYSGSTTSLDTLRTRMLVPTGVFALVAGASVVGFALEQAATRRLGRSTDVVGARVAFVALMFAAGALPVIATGGGRTARPGGDNAFGQERLRSAVLLAVPHDPHTSVFSNDYWVAALVNDRPVDSAPIARYPGSNAAPADPFGPIRDAAASGPTVVVWRDGFLTDFMEPFSVLVSRCDLVPIDRLADGTVYRVERCS
jgi:4-amino-4-deoxy-L-arabinose transferase-like glycosyltransferase